VIGLLDSQRKVKHDLRDLLIRLIDFGSAINEEVLTSRTYYPEPPSQMQETTEYQPPEALFNDLPFNYSKPESYDIWSAGKIKIVGFEGVIF
jgi:serine/threonine protein kinase